MSSVHESYKRKLKDLEDERDMAKIRCLEAEIKLEITESNSNQVPKDPFQLPDPCVENILKYLSGKELLDVMEVCKHWKNTIEGRKAIMDRAMDEVVAEFDSYEFLGNIGSCVPSKRAFKHIRTYFQSYFEYDTRLLPLALIYVKSLVTLEIECKSFSSEFDGSDMRFLEPITFPNLKSLSLYSDVSIYYPSYFMGLHRNLVRFIKSCSFPEVTKLSLCLLSECRCAPYEFDHNLAFNDIVCNMPKLKALSCDMMWVNAVETPENLPQLKILVTACDEISAYFHSLTELYIDCNCSGHVFDLILRSCKQLKVIQIGGFGEGQDIYWNEILQFPQHSNMEKFIVAKYDDTCEDYDELQKVLPSFPNLKVLVLNCEFREFITLEFLALNMAKLEKLICKQLHTPTTASYYLALLYQDDRSANVKIQVEEDPYCCEEEIDFLEKFNEFNL